MKSGRAVVDGEARSALEAVRPALTRIIRFRNSTAGMQTGGGPLVLVLVDCAVSGRLELD